MTRREALGGLATAAVAVAAPGRSWASTMDMVDDKSTHLWFGDESDEDVFHAYAVEHGSDGALWVEYDDGNFYGFAPGQWEVEGLARGHRLWLRETEGAWAGYSCLTDLEAETLLEDV